MNRYPTEQELVRIKNWDYRDPMGLIDFIEPIFEEYGTVSLTGKRVKTLYLATGGWSGNESIISALKDNLLFWSLCWVKSERGGAFTFKIK